MPAMTRRLKRNCGRVSEVALGPVPGEEANGRPLMLRLPTMFGAASASAIPSATPRSRGAQQVAPEDRRAEQEAGGEHADRVLRLQADAEHDADRHPRAPRRREREPHGEPEQDGLEQEVEGHGLEQRVRPEQDGVSAAAAAAIACARREPPSSRAISAQTTTTRLRRRAERAEPDARLPEEDAPAGAEQAVTGGKST